MGDQNDLIRLPKEIAHLDSLEVLVLNKNKLQTLPKEIGQLQSLRSLEVTANQLKSLPTEILDLKTLDSFYCFENPLTNLSSKMTSFLEKHGSLKNPAMPSAPPVTEDVVIVYEVITSLEQVKKNPKKVP